MVHAQVLWNEGEADETAVMVVLGPDDGGVLGATKGGGGWMRVVLPGGCRDARAGARIIRGVFRAA